MQLSLFPGYCEFSKKCYTKKKPKKPRLPDGFELLDPEKQIQLLNEGVGSTAIPKDEQCKMVLSARHDLYNSLNDVSTNIKNIVNHEQQSGSLYDAHISKPLTKLQIDGAYGLVKLDNGNYVATRGKYMGCEFTKESVQGGLYIIKEVVTTPTTSQTTTPFTLSDEEYAELNKDLPYRHK